MNSPCTKCDDTRFFCLVHTASSALCPAPSLNLPMLTCRMYFVPCDRCRDAAEPTDEPCGTCDWGHCNGVVVAWRWSDECREWLPVCWSHRRGPHT